MPSPLQTPHRRPRLLVSLAISSLGVLAMGGVRFVFHIAGIHLYGPRFIGTVATYYSWAMLVGTLLAAPLGTAAARFVAADLGAGKVAPPRRIFTELLFLILVLSAAGASVAFFIASAPWNFFLSILLLTTVIALFFQAVFFAFGKSTSFLIARLVALTVFAAVFSIGALSGRRYLLPFSLIADQAAFNLLSVLLLRHDFILPRAEDLFRLITVGRYALFVMGLTVSGTATSHLIVVLGGLFLESKDATGYLSVLLAAASPLNAITMALANVFLPELSYRRQRYGLPEVRRLVFKGTFGVAGLVLPATLALVIGSQHILPLLGVPPSPLATWTWAILCISLSLSAISAPSGHFLNSTDLVRHHSVLSVVAALAALITGVLALPLFSILGGAMMRLAASGTLLLGRTTLALTSLASPDHIRHSSRVPSSASPNTSKLDEDG